MKKWTVMLIPHDRGTTRNLELAVYQVATVVLVMMLLSFSTAFLLKRHQILSAQAHRLQELAQQLERQRAATPPPVSSGLAESERAELEQRLRAEYEANIATITAELNALYEVEAKVRQLTDLAPRKPSKVVAAITSKGGKGGGPSLLDPVYRPISPVIEAPPHLIYGMSTPSADLIIQEINLRTASLKSLVADIEHQRERVDHTPAVWPVGGRNSSISSAFGYRKDPFTNRIRHHDGTDICGPYGAPILATAEGTVEFAGTDKYLGNVVRISHGNGLVTIYAHLKDYSVRIGEKVKKSQRIGSLGTTGRTTGAHLHYEVHLNGRVVDSGKYLGN